MHSRSEFSGHKSVKVVLLLLVLVLLETLIVPSPHLLVDCSESLVNSSNVFLKLNKMTYTLSFSKKLNQKQHNSSVFQNFEDSANV